MKAITVQRYNADLPVIHERARDSIPTREEKRISQVYLVSNQLTMLLSKLSQKTDEKWRAAHVVEQRP